MWNLVGLAVVEIALRDALASALESGRVNVQSPLWNLHAVDLTDLVVEFVMWSFHFISFRWFFIYRMCGEICE